MGERPLGDYVVSAKTRDPEFSYDESSPIAVHLPGHDYGDVEALTLAAQFWQARRRVETWALWCLVNLVSVGLYASQALWFTSAVYAVLLGVALYGWRAWGRAERGMA